MSLNAAERETVITVSDDDELVRIFTCQRKALGKMRRDDRFTEVRGGQYHGATEWAEFTIPADKWNPVTGAKRRGGMTDEQKDAARARLARVREEQA